MTRIFGPVALIGLALMSLSCTQNAAPANDGAAARPAIQVDQISQFDGAMIIPDGTAADALPVAAKDYCGAKPICAVHGWTKAADAARAMPMTDREAETQVFSYAINRSSGFERSLWACSVYPRTNPDECLADLQD